MATTNGNRKILDLKRWEMVAPCPSITQNGYHTISSRNHDQLQLHFAGATAYLYDPYQDGWVQAPNPALAGSAGGGSCGIASSFSTGTTVGASILTATAGTTTSITTNQTIVMDLRGYSVLFTGGTNAGKLKTIQSNTLGANSVITFDSAEASAFDNTSQYRLQTPTFFALNAGTIGAGSFKKYDRATNTWTTLANSGLPASWGTDGKLVSTPSWIGSGFKSFATGTASSGASTTITDSSKSWTTNQWANSQVRITSGTGAGQIRSISSNTGTEITVSSAWTANPDNTSQYSIEGNDDYIYLLGNGAVTLYRYSISGNSWSTLTPASARAGAPGAGFSGHWIYNVSASDWTNEGAIKNGRYIYSFRGTGAILDRYDIAANTWVSSLSYTPATENIFGKWTYSGDALYAHLGVTGRFFRFDLASSVMSGWTQLLYPNGVSVTGDTVFSVQYRDGATVIEYVYFTLNNSAVTMRQMVI